VKLPADLKVETRHIIRVLDDKLAQQIDDFEMRLAAVYSGYKELTDWHPVIPPGWGDFPQLPIQHAVVYRGNEQTWAYSHHHTIAKSGDTYVMAWSNGFRHEDYPGQEVHFATSKDGLAWTEPGVVVSTPEETGIVRNNAGLYVADDGKAYCYVGVADNFKRDVAPPGMMSMDKPRIHLEVHVSDDLVHWTPLGKLCDDIYLFEGPRKTRGGKLICAGSHIETSEMMVLVWDDPSQPAAMPRFAHVPHSSEGVTAGQSSWYQTDDGRIWMYSRRGEPCNLALSLSDDEGESWTELCRTDFPNTNVRAYAGRLADGRFFIASSISAIHLDRRHLHIALSDDGRTFDRQYTLIQGETTRRINGRHKEDGWHYANCLVDGDRLFVAHSINKEDIAVAIVDMSQVE